MSSTAFSLTNWQFTTNPPSRRSVLDRVVTLQVQATINFAINPDWVDLNGAPNPNNLLQAGRDSLRAYPLSSIFQNVQCHINGFPVNVELYDLISSMSRFHNGLDDQIGMTSITANYLDCWQMYLDADGSNRNPLGLYSDSNVTSFRGAYSMNIALNDPTIAQVIVNINEQLQLPPYLWGRASYEEAAGLTNVDTLSFNFTIVSAPQIIWSHSTNTDLPANINNPPYPGNSTTANHLNTSILGTVTVEFAQPIMQLVFLTPQIFQIAPEIIQYPYHQINRYVTQTNKYLAPYLVNGYQAFNLQTNIIQFESIPEKIYIFAKQTNNNVYSSLNFQVSHTDTFLQINSLAVNFANKKGLFSGATPAQLYQMSCKNGLNIDWDAWNGITQDMGTNGGAVQYKGLTGSIICINVSQDLSLSSGDAEGRNISMPSIVVF